MTRNTIYALSTVYGKSGVAVIRISGNKVLDIISQITSIDINIISLTKSEKLRLIEAW